MELTWVDGSGNIHVSPRNSTAGNALVAGLGVAGVVTELLLQLHPHSHTKLHTRFKQSDENILADVKAMLQVRPARTAPSGHVAADVCISNAVKQQCTIMGTFVNVTASPPPSKSCIMIRSTQCVLFTSLNRC